MKATSRHTTYPKIGTIQRWKREKSAGDQNFPAGILPFVFQDTSDDDGCSMDYVPSNRSGQFIEECEKNNISKTQHDPTVDARDMATEAVLVHPNPAPLCNRILYRLSPLFIFLSLFFFFNLVAFAVFKGTIVLLITFMSLIYVFIYYLFFFFMETIRFVSA